MSIPEAFFWTLLVSGIWASVILQIKANRRDRTLDDFVRYKR